MGQRRAGWALAVLGAAFVALSALADPLGVGDSDGIGMQQTAGLIVGGVVLLAGLALLYRTRSTTGSPRAEI
jgi:hypothetical protein